MPVASSAIATLLSGKASASAPANAGAAAPSANESSVSVAPSFAQALSDAGAAAEGKGGKVALEGKNLPLSASAAQAGIRDNGLLALLNGQADITAENAELMLHRIELLEKNGAAATEAAALAAIKSQLQGIIKTGAAKTAAQILQNAPAADGIKLAELLVAAGFEKKKSEKAQEAATEALTHAAPETTLSLTISPARVAKKAAVVEAKKSALDAVEAPVIVASVVPSPLAAPVIEPVKVADVSAKPGIVAVRADLNQIVPPLTGNEPAKLPQVDLPTLGHAKEVKEINLAAPSVGAVHPFLALNAAAKALHSPSNAVLVNHAPVAEQVHVAISHAAKDGLGAITIQLDPVDLGRVEVSLQTNKDGLTQVSFIVDKPETFDSLSRDARTLERSLQEAGIKADTGSMQFNLRQQPQAHADMGGQRQPGNQPHAEEEAKAASIIGVQAASFARNYTVDIHDGVDISA